MGVFNVVVWFVSAWECDGVWCVCVCVIYCVCCLCGLLLLYLNVVVWFVWGVLCDVVWFAVVSVIVCVSFNVFVWCLWISE